MRLWAIVLVSTSGLGLSGCFTARKRLVLPPAPAVIAKPLPDPQIEPLPEIEIPLPRIEIPAVTLRVSPPPETTAPKPAPARRPGPVTPTPAPPGPVVPEGGVEPSPPVVTTPQLGEILTDDRRRQYEALFAERVSVAQAALTRASGRRLTTRQRETVQRIRTFVQQAEESKVKDLVTALELARRADLLGRDLLKSLQ